MRKLRPEDLLVLFVSMMLMSWVFVGIVVPGIWEMVFCSPDGCSAGEFGDRFGGVNALFSGIALVGVVVTIRVQFQELRLQHEELEKSANALQQQVDVSLQTHARSIQLGSMPLVFAEVESLVLSIPREGQRKDLRARFGEDLLWPLRVELRVENASEATAVDVQVGVAIEFPENRGFSRRVHQDVRIPYVRASQVSQTTPLLILLPSSAFCGAVDGRGRIAPLLAPCLRVQVRYKNVMRAEFRTDQEFVMDATGHPSDFVQATRELKGSLEQDHITTKQAGAWFVLDGNAPPRHDLGVSTIQNPSAFSNGLVRVLPIRALSPFES